MQQQGATQRPEPVDTVPTASAERGTPRVPARPGPPRQDTPPPVLLPVVAPPRESWERIVLADGIELHVRADRRQERILLDALVRQARTLLGEP